jgi:prophage regulatory protein
MRLNAAHEPEVTMNTANDNEPPLDELLRLCDVVRITKLSNTTIYRRMDECSFPRQVKLSPGCARWRTSDIRSWLKDLKTPEELQHATRRQAA